MMSKKYKNDKGELVDVCSFVGCDREGCNIKEHIDECEGYLEMYVK